MNQIVEIPGPEEYPYEDFTDKMASIPFYHKMYCGQYKILCWGSKYLFLDAKKVMYYYDDVHNKLFAGEQSMHHLEDEDECVAKEFLE